MKRLAVCVVLVVCIGCAGAGSEVSGDLSNVGGVTVTFRVAPAAVKVGQSVTVGFRLVNNSGRNEELTFPTGQHYDLWATSEGREVWRWSHDRVFVQEITRATILPQSGLTFAESWTPPRAGTYIVHGRLTAKRYERSFTGELRVE